MKEATSFFIERTGDKIYVRLKIVGDVDEAVHALLDHFYHENPILNGIVVEEIFFKNKGLDKVINDAKDQVIEAVRKALDECEFSKASSLPSLLENSPPTS